MREAMMGLAAMCVVACGDSVTTTPGPTGSATTTATGGGTASGGQGGTTATTGGGGNGGGGGQGCSAETCSAPGHVCVGGECIEDCRLPGAIVCTPPQVCDVGSEHPGKCVPLDEGCVVTGPTAKCGTNTCGPGSACDPDQGQCYASLPCTKVACQGGTCWGEGCPCERPPATCIPAPLGKPGDKGTLNDHELTKCGKLASCDGGIVDLDFDQSCNAFGVTIISGADYLRRIDPQGQVTSYTGVTNLDMGEVATVQGDDGTFGGSNLGDVVALTYICCPNCGCNVGPNGSQQGVAYLDNGMLPMVIPSVSYTVGDGPFYHKVLDAGPYGLSWGLDKVLYVGNTSNNGEYHAVDLKNLKTQLVHTFAKRVLASAPFDKLRMMVALDGGEVYKVPILGASGMPELLIALGKDVTSIQRDRWSGQIYAELDDGQILRFEADGSGLFGYQQAPKPGRITIAPDGYLYHLTPGFINAPEIVRWQLPTKL